MCTHVRRSLETAPEEEEEEEEIRNGVGEGVEWEEEKLVRSVSLTGRSGALLLFGMMGTLYYVCVSAPNTRCLLGLPADRINISHVTKISHRCGIQTCLSAFP